MKGGEENSMSRQPLLKLWTGPIARVLRWTICGLMILGVIPPAAFAVSVVSVGNSPSSVDGSYLNAGDIADTLALTNVHVIADSEIKYLEDVNFGTSPDFGPTFFDLTNTAPTTSILGNVTWANYAGAVFIVDSSQVNLAGSFHNVSNALIGATQLQGNATNVNVLSNDANLQQAIDLTQTSSGPSTITAAFGTASSLAFDYDTSMILSGGLLSGLVAMNQANSHLELDGYGFELDTGSGFAGIGTGPISATSGQLMGYLNSGDPFTVSFTQSTSDQISLVSTSVVPIPGALVLFSSGLMGLLGAARRKAT
jgi:hypothetical protein